MALINRYTDTLNGGMTFIGNTVGLSQLTNTNEAGTVGSIGAFTSLNQGLQVPTFPVGTTLNISDNGSSSDLVIPAGSVVVRAELIWGGSYYYKTTSTPPNPADATIDITALIDNPVVFTPPSGATKAA